MCWKFLDLVFKSIKESLKDFCPCLIESKESSHQLEDLRKTTFRGKERGQERVSKIFTIETMKKMAPMKRASEDEALQTRDDCFVLEKCPWDTTSSDLFLRVGKSVFLVHQLLLSIESEILKTIIDSVPAVKNITTMVTLNGYEADEIKMLLTFVYLPESEINERNILTLLKLADELMIEELVIRCEDFLLNTDCFSPIFLLNLAFKYQLPSLEESAAIQASKIPEFVQQRDFYSLNEKQREKVLFMAKNRYRSGMGVYENRKSPIMKVERRLRERENDFQGRLAFLPEPEVVEATCKQTTT